ncbi:secreted protein containing Thioredoxin domain protein [Rhodopirellula maiorica SM1]|uniref:Secreted protein containing Thioredoxin domain protein n=1 Tax=Rhodopirellula maiorica SM1 TaxID=1265738 RepID=M5RC28_9BACT|nr:thioredoxin family protein [Rhodopirellula maiorica]EMI17043.1 secreted protein containing Thioredoxin domain protein [Rhodopirellula maiorica SM1]
MNDSQKCTLLLLSVVVATASGCSAAAGFGFGRTVSSDLSGVVKESEVIQQDAIANANSATTTKPIAASKTTADDNHIAPVSATQSESTASTTLASLTTTPAAQRPTLITLPASGDLDAVMAEANGNVLLDFYADWCGPCRKQSVILHELESTAAENNTLIVKVNVDEHKQIAREMQVSSLPTLVMVKNGEIVKRETGITRKADLVRWMQ